MVRIGYFGGSFDPPHRGHLAVACAARDRFGLGRVLLAPTGRQPFKLNGSSAPFDQRCRMTELLCTNQAALELSTIDAPHPDGSPNYTVDALRRLGKELPTEAELFAVVGADAFLGLPQWHSASELLDMAEWIVVSRPGFALERLAAMALTPAQRAHVHLLEGISDTTSATDVRSRVETHLPCGDLLPEPVLAYIQRHNLYGS